MPTGSAKGRMRCPWDRKLRVLGWGQWPLPGTEGHFGEERKQKIRKQPGKASKWCAVGGADGRIQNREKRLVTTTQHSEEGSRRWATQTPLGEWHPASHSGLCSCSCVWWQVSSLSSIGVKGLWRHSLTLLPHYLWENGGQTERCWGIRKGIVGLLVNLTASTSYSRRQSTFWVQK